MQSFFFLAFHFHLSSFTLPYPVQPIPVWVRSFQDFCFRHSCFGLNSLAWMAFHDSIWAGVVFSASATLLCIHPPPPSTSFCSSVVSSPAQAYGCITKEAEQDEGALQAQSLLFCVHSCTFLLSTFTPRFLITFSTFGLLFFRRKKLESPFSGIAYVFFSFRVIRSLLPTIAWKARDVTSLFLLSHLFWIILLIGREGSKKTRGMAKDEVVVENNDHWHGGDLCVIFLLCIFVSMRQLKKVRGKRSKKWIRKIKGEG